MNCVLSQDRSKFLRTVYSAFFLGKFLPILHRTHPSVMTFKLRALCDTSGFSDVRINARTSQSYDQRLLTDFTTHRFAFSQLLLGAVEIEVDVQTFQELRDRVAIRVGFLLDDLDQVLENGSPAFVGDDGSGQVT